MQARNLSFHDVVLCSLYQGCLVSAKQDLVLQLCLTDSLFQMMWLSGLRLEVD